MMLGRLNIANYNDAREQAIAESDEGKVIVNSDAAALRAMYTDEQICALLGVPEASDEEIERARARIERKRRKDQLTSGLCACIMIVATIAGLVMLFVPEYETPYFWLAWGHRRPAVRCGRHRGRLLREGSTELIELAFPAASPPIAHPTVGADLGLPSQSPP